MSDSSERSTVIKNLLYYRKQLQQELATTERALAGYGVSVDMLGASQRKTGAGQARGDSSGHAGGIQSSVNELLTKYSGQWLSTTTVVNMLGELGVIDPNIRVSRSAVATALQRAAISGVADRRKVPGKKRYEFSAKGSAAPGEAALL